MDTEGAAEEEGWHALEEVQSQESFEAVEAELVAEDRIKMLRSSDGYKRKHSAAASSSNEGAKRATTEKKDACSMEVDRATGEYSDVDFDWDETHEC